MSERSPMTHLVLLAGGSGTRFWPLGRRKRPKQVLPLRPGGKSLLAETFARLESLPLEPKRFLLPVSDELRPVMAAALPRFPEAGFLREPTPRDTAPVLGLLLANLLCEGAAEEDRIALLPSDHVIAPKEAFHRTLLQALDLATRDRRLWTLGIRPNEPATGYGYIQMGDPLPGGGRRVRRFLEKPSAKTARTLLEGGEHLWNAGILIGTLGAFLDAARERNPDFLQGIERLAEAMKLQEEQQVKEAFLSFEKTSIDYALLEGNPLLGVVEADFDWKDLGSFDTLAEDLDLDSRGNALLAGGEGQTLFWDCDNNLCVNRGEGTLVLLGVKDLIVVRDGDKLLVLPKGRSQEIKVIVEELERRGSGDQL
ncbi:MAG TPA: hypothetical protein ENK02_08470 [Planctomycetes bacterium]|nr:hypothetical protein [Planctomycetota bacterium]